MAAPEDARSVALVGLPLVVVAWTFFFMLLGAIAVGIRTYSRLRLKSFGLDDAMAVFAMLTFVVVAAFTLHGANMGVGTRNAGLNAWLAVESSRWYLFWILVYLSGMVALKTSVCTTLLRILPPSITAFRACVWVLIFVSWAAWEGKPTCGGQEVMVAISQTVAVASVLTDTGCALLPGIMLWKTQMAKTSKLEVFALVSIASIASVATIARAPFLSHYADPTNDLTYYEGYMVLFSNVETGIGLFASTGVASGSGSAMMDPTRASSCRTTTARGSGSTSPTRWRRILSRRATVTVTTINDWTEHVSHERGKGVSKNKH
ncbi:uncharacterized protein PG986_013018 [Apiospora aurea]|uniref:Rhodopsin domain-containing protein n=1 Tax=Apiospora aurea TaxID=335848 RepID=A0ABR1Q1M5_9PEZI